MTVHTPNTLRRRDGLCSVTPWRGAAGGDDGTSGIETAANVRASGKLASALGEGFADGLDVAGF